MALTLADQATLATSATFRARVRAAIARFAAYQANLPAGHAEKLAALAEWAPQAAADATVLEDWVSRTVWYGVTKAIDSNLADLAAAEASAFDNGLKAAIEAQIRKAHGL